MEAQLDELFSFLRDPRPDVRQLAAKNIAGLTTTPEFLPFFKKDGCRVVKDLMALTKGEPLAAHDALSALINLCVDPVFVSVMDNEDFLYDLILLIVLPRNVVADLCCMLLNNLSESNSVARKLVADISRSAAAPSPSAESTSPIPTPSTQPNPSTTKLKTHYLDNLLEVFVRGAGKGYNPDAEYHFLGGVLSNVAMTPAGAAWFRGRTGVDGALRLSKMVPFTEHPNRIRRSAAIHTIKNTAFEPEGHALLLTDTELNLLPYLLLPLSGPEDYTDEEMEGMPDELQLLEPDKEREQDAKLRLALVEILLLLTTTRQGREILRAKKVYPVVQKLHLQEKDEKVQEAIERLVQMLCRDEEDGGSTNLPIPVAKRLKSVDAKDYVIEEMEDSDSDSDGGMIEQLL
ncbi:uncharacterized protein SPPG_03601 [Spizellomyces punctatus DAOM BR117]|uniref:Protein HGH1 homolog n=1 Tax=Spizellomyces punctatus (strain DAOM BR117) TaxID=645134 RepID=A0A0L0HLN1_SPIPD|nr:uncharacterized protein SPPG_03601 [Spizellomyces punctatus DAOM BR117]KND01810.1 hypothetical protein SPPG_03601 [Spizellomyces punctatus DAOM BR117]|eukprot:XP_016609849.1 hypothetical protein SPPG_03601 [Spizellomyces punctatus DAOM BR117]